MRLNFIRALIKLILPPRRTEAIVEALTIDNLVALQTADGLPYSHDLVRALVWEIKYYANPHTVALAGELLAEELLAIASEELGRPLLIPVPMHTARRRLRGHNQTELLCESALKHLGASADIPERKSSGLPSRVGPIAGQTIFSGASASALDYAPKALVRTRATPEQQKLSRAERLTNLINSMEADPSIVKGRACIVVDDVTTTGATLAETKRALLAAGASRVHTVALAQS